MISLKKLQVSILFLLWIIGGHALAQSTKGLEIKKDEQQQNLGKTYALIVGISKYQYPECYPTLHYADVDARTFYNYMISKSGGNVAPSNIDTLFNDGATQQDFWKKFCSIKNRLQKDDNFYIYFSGHGDAISSDLAFLLTYNAPPGNDRNNYFTSNGVVDIHQLKSLIKLITLDKTKPAHVFLITDACRSNELPPGKEEGRQQFYEEMYTKNAGEVQLVSCLANQVSFEDVKWGGGRGLFSWHLVNGLMGMADYKPEDGTVTLKELITYVSDKVQEDSYDPTNKKYRQTPDYCCKDKDDVVLAKVDKVTKDQLTAQLKQGSFFKSDLPTYASNKGVNLGEEMRNEGYEGLYKKFITAINTDKLVEPADDNAMNYLDQLLAKNIKPELKSDLKFELSSRLMNDVTGVINNYLHNATNNNAYTYNYFMTAVRKLKAFQNIADTLYYNAVDVRANILFLEGHSNWLSNKTHELRACMLKADSAIALKPNAAYLYYLKGLLHIQLKEYKDAFVYERKAMSLAPNWTYPYNDLGTLSGYVNRYDSALFYLLRASKMDPRDQALDLNIAYIYSQIGQMDSAIYYCRNGLAKDPSDFMIWCYLGNIYAYQKKTDSSLFCYHAGIQSNSTYFNNYEGALRLHLDNGNSDSVTYYYHKMMATDSTNPIIYNHLGDIFYKYNYDTIAVQMYSTSIGIDSMNAESWLHLANVLDRLKQYEQEEKCLLFALNIDTTASNDGVYNQLGKYYYRQDNDEKALKAMANAIKINPDNAAYYYNYGFISSDKKDIVTAEKYYRATIKKDSRYYQAYYELAKILIGKSNKDDALNMLEQAIKYGDYTRKDIEDERAFSGIKDDGRFKALMVKMKE